MKYHPCLVYSSVAEFLGCWAVRGKANLTLDTMKGVTTVSFTTTLPGHPESPLHPPPPPAGAPAPSPPPFPPPRRPRHRRTAEKERNRQRAARHQASMAMEADSKSLGSLATSISSSSDSSTTEPVESPMSTENIFKCNHCELVFKNNKGLKIHIGRTHKSINLNPLKRSKVSLSVRSQS